MTWREISLKEICSVDWGNTKLTKSSYLSEGKYLAVSAAGADGLIDHYEHESNVPVLSAIGAQCGRMFYPGARFTAIKNTITLTPKKDMADGKFLYYLFTHVELPQRGAGQPFISKGDIEAFRVSIPVNLEKQREIVQKLDTAFADVDSLSTKKNHQFANSREIFRAVCKAQIDLLNPSSYVPLKELSALITKGTTPTTLGHKFKDKGINFIKVEAIDETGNLIPGKFTFIDDSAHKALLRSQLQENDVLVSITGALGRSTLVGLQHIPANISQNLALVRLPIESKITHQYLASLFMSDYFELNQIGAGVAQQALSLTQIGSLQVPILTMENQAKFIDFIQDSQQSTETLCQNLKTQQLLFSELKSAILSNEFNGAA
jgi:restriction endonuclease S subunit